ncbi:hypothetical protein BDV25DRAFT_123564 [Aspergillus avenaceus]|uniref:N-acetyltransferase domain-containing protein n=1 Tax=Aspergillus avenaceus TaxID=36643 RepID=A0A5N6TTU0_ASPAV|nr:hypothetical protein BDV25DRAFT_123564 [Aspergillus avenaceus]
MSNGKTIKMPIPNNITSIPKHLAHGELEAVIMRYKALRLLGLKEHPEAFSSKYEIEVKFPRERWVSRIENSAAKTFIALNPHSDSEALEDDNEHSIPRLFSHDWLGTITIQGPKILYEGDEMLSKAPWDLFFRVEESSVSADVAGGTTVYMLGALFVQDSGRRKGNGRRLIERAVEEVYKEAVESRVSRMLVVVIAEPRNDSALRLYKACGFKIWEDKLVLYLPWEQQCVAMTLDVSVTEDQKERIVR